jgi:hypothetical protein
MFLNPDSLCRAKPSLPRREKRSLLGFFVAGRI